MMMRLSVACMKNGAPPSARIFFTMAALGRASRALRRRALPALRKYATVTTALTPWAMTLAAAAPCTPQPSTKMNTGSSTMLSTAPDAMATSARLELPCASTKGLRPRYAITKNVPVR